MSRASRTCRRVFSTAPSFWSGPMVTAGSIPSPTTIASIREEALQERRRDRFVEERPRGARAGLPRVGELAREEVARREVEVGVVVDHEGRMPAELHGHALHERPRLPAEMPADGRRPGERDVPDRGMPEERPAGVVRAGRGDHVDHPGREAGRLEQPRGGEGAERGLAVGLDDEGAARREGRSALPGDHREGVVAGADQQGRPDRLAEDELVLPRVLGGHDLPVEAAPLGRVPADEAHPVVDLAARFGEGLPLLEGDEPRERLAMPLHEGRRPA